MGVHQARRLRAGHERKRNTLLLVDNHHDQVGIQDQDSIVFADFSCFHVLSCTLILFYELRVCYIIRGLFIGSKVFTFINVTGI